MTHNTRSVQLLGAQVQRRWWSPYGYTALSKNPIYYKSVREEFVDQPVVHFVDENAGHGGLLDPARKQQNFFHSREFHVRRILNERFISRNICEEALTMLAVNI